MLSTIFTCGDINGIGPEIVVKTINKYPPNRRRKIIFVCPRNIFEYTLQLVSPKFDFTIQSNIPVDNDPSKVLVIDIGLIKQNLGKPTNFSGRASFNSISEALRLVDMRIGDCIITSPISKHAFKKAGIDFPGHTELFASHYNVSEYVMMFVSKKMKAGLVTIHIPINEVANSITIEKINSTISVITNSLKKDFGIQHPRIALLGLNPHAGEAGQIGTEEEEIIKPALKNWTKYVQGPFVPDAFFGRKTYEKFDCTIGLYHDQLLIPFKLMNFDSGVNFTAGLPIVRTSPDHGTAFDIAGKGIANPSSMIEAFKTANKICKVRKSNN